MRLRELRNKELRSTGIRAFISHRNHTGLMLEIILFIINGITRIACSITLRVTTLNHETVNNTMEHKTIVEARAGEIYKVRYGIRSSLEVQVYNDFTLMSRNLGKNLGNTRVILVENFTCGKRICGKTQGTANNELFKQNVTSVVISFR